MRKRPLLTRKTAARFRELEAALDVADGIAEALLSDTIRDIRNGNAGVILETWNWDDPDKAAAELKRLGARWAAEDGKEAA